MTYTKNYRDTKADPDLYHLKKIRHRFRPIFTFTNRLIILTGFRLARVSAVFAPRASLYKVRISFFIFSPPDPYKYYRTDGQANQLKLPTYQLFRGKLPFYSTAFPVRSLYGKKRSKWTYSFVVRWDLLHPHSSIYTLLDNASAVRSEVSAFYLSTRSAFTEVQACQIIIIPSSRPC